jgi:hypothetical protein
VHTTHCLGACVESSVRQQKGKNKGIWGKNVGGKPAVVALDHADHRWHTGAVHSKS